MFKKILFPINQSKEPLEVIHKTTEITRMNNIHLIVLSIIEPKHYEMNPIKTLEIFLEQAKKIAENFDMTYELIKRDGNPESVICNEAEKLNVDVIVIGTRGINLEANSQSTASKVLEFSNRPVLVVP
tara:strand:+ start:414 stop:797 length:384 start_codon:yes stop_codon:yes gene_type:complete